MTSSWTAPKVERNAPGQVLPERQALEAWLDYQRLTLLFKCSGLGADQLKQRPVPPSSLSLLGLVRHMTEVERWWFRANAANQAVQPIYCSDDNPNGDFDDLDGADAQADLQALRSEIERATEAVKDMRLDATFAGHGRRQGTSLDLRWAYIHMIEEYARHNGHADLIREQVDGATGD